MNGTIYPAGLGVPKRLKVVALIATVGTAMAWLLLTGCSHARHGSEREPWESDPTARFPLTDYSYGHQTHILFSFEGTPEEALAPCSVKDYGISDDPRVQKFVEALQAQLRERNYVRHRIHWRAEKALARLATPGFRGNLFLDDAEVSTIEFEGITTKQFMWRDLEGKPTSSAREDQLGTSYLAYEGTIEVVYAQQSVNGYGFFTQLRVSAPLTPPTRAIPGVEMRNGNILKWGVMGIVVSRDQAQLPPGLVQRVSVSLSMQPGASSEKMDGLVAAALNQTVGPNELVQFYRHASLREFGDSDERVSYYERAVKSAQVVRRPPAIDEEGKRE